MSISGKTLGRSPRIKVSLTQEAIDSGVRRSSSHCMFAEAIMESVPTAKGVAVDLQTVRFSNREKGERYTYLTPRPLQIALVNFDRGTNPEPFNFELRSGHTTRLYKQGRSQKTSLRTPTTGGMESIKERVGGQPPPIAKGARRGFGLRAFKY